MFTMRLWVLKQSFTDIAVDQLTGRPCAGLSSPCSIIPLLCVPSYREATILERQWTKGWKVTLCACFPHLSSTIVTLAKFGALLSVAQQGKLLDEPRQLIYGVVSSCPVASSYLLCGKRWFAWLETMRSIFFKLHVSSHFCSLPNGSFPLLLLLKPRDCGEKRFRDGADYLRMSYHSGDGSSEMLFSILLTCPFQNRTGAGFSLPRLLWSMLSWLPEQMLPGSVRIAEMIGWDGGFFHLSPRASFLPKKGMYSLFVVCRHSLKNTAVTSTVWFHVPTQMLCELSSLR